MKQARRNNDRALFLDRDGVINEDRHYVHRREDFVVLPRVFEALRLARKFGYLTFVVSNQAGVARGYYDLSAVNALHEHMLSIFADEGVSIDGIYFCPHHTDGVISEFAVRCACRKPKPGMILRAAQDFRLNLAESILVGDKMSDVQAGGAAGVGKNCLVVGAAAARLAPPVGATYVQVESLYDAVRRSCVDRDLDH